MKTKQIISIIIVVIAFTLMGFFLSWIKGEGRRCMQDPLNYGFKKSTIVCHCKDVHGNYYDLDQTGFKKVDFSDMDYFSLNFNFTDTP